MLRGELVEYGLIMGEDGLNLLAVQEAAVDLDDALVGDAVHLHAAFDDADIARGGAEQRVPGVLQALVVLIQGEDDAGHGGDGH